MLTLILVCVCLLSGCRLKGWTNFGGGTKPSADNTFALQLCISDENKPLLLANEDFVPYLVDALLLDPEHPRAGLKEAEKIWCQEHHADCLAQLAVFEPAREALRQDPSVISAMESVAEVGLSAVARQFAQAALLALNDKEMHVNVHVDDQRHVMLSYQWDKQATVKRLNDSLIGRGYVTWFDLSNMKGSVLDAMSEAVEGAEVMLYG